MLQRYDEKQLIPSFFRNIFLSCGDRKTILRQTWHTSQKSVAIGSKKVNSGMLQSVLQHDKAIGSQVDGELLLSLDLLCLWSDRLSIVVVLIISIT